MADDTITDTDTSDSFSDTDLSSIDTSICNADSDNSPTDLKLKCLTFSADCHPDLSLFCLADANGFLTVMSYANDTLPELLFKSRCFKETCRRAIFHPNGEFIYAGGGNSLKLVDMTKEKVVTIFRGDSTNSQTVDSIYSICHVADSIVAVGNDAGTVSIFDQRCGHSSIFFQQTDDYISDMVSDGRFLVCSSGDGSLHTFNAKSGSHVLSSESLSCDLQSIARVKGGKKLVVGDLLGNLNIFNWRQFGNISDRFPSHLPSVDCLVALSDNVICAGCNDGRIRAFSIQPNGILGLVGDHKGDAVESLTSTFDSALVLSVGHDDYLRFWDTQYVLENSFGPGRGQNRKGKPLNAKVETKATFYSELDAGLCLDEMISDSDS